ncbi:MAG: leucine-rich repeat protein [Alistipes sp.]|nr:leucine-rich repeat protein [Alistipes sp.]
MRKLFTNILLIVALVLSSCAYDDTAVWSKLDDHESRISTLEELCREMNTNISALQSLVDAMQGGDYITSIVPVTKDGSTIGYTITFAENDPITIYHGTNGKDGANGTDGKDGADGQDGADGKDGANGKDGADGYTPVIGVKQDSDGIYYWTLDGTWLLDDNGNKIKAVGTDGKDGQDGANGADGEDGKDGQDGANGADGEDGKDGQDGTNGSDGKDGADGITPQLKIENGYWYVSYNNGTSWTQLGKATGEDGLDGANGADGKDGDSFFQSVDTSNPDYIVFTLTDGTEIKIPTWYSFELLQELCNQMNSNIDAIQTIIAALQEKDYIESVTPIVADGKEVGYTIAFAKSGIVKIYHGKDGANGADGKDGANGADGKDGADGYTPVIGVKQDSDSIYYWTLDGEWLLDDNGNKIKAVGTDGKDGQDGANGADGEDGKDGQDGADGADGTNGNDGANGTDGKDGVDGITPQLKIEEGYWYVSYDNGASWTQLGKATGEDGQDGANGADGVNGDAFFANVTVGEESVSFTLADGTEFVVPLVADSLLALLGDISYIPKYTDGKATVTRYADGIILAEFDFSVTPKSMATTIAENYETLLAINAIETVTRAVTLIRMPIVACEADEKSGTISIQASGEFLNPGAFTGDITYSAALTISDGVNSVISDYIELCTYVSTEDSPEQEPETPVDPENPENPEIPEEPELPTDEKIIYYTTSDAAPVKLGATTGFGGILLSNEYDVEANLGKMTFSATVTCIPANAFKSSTISTISVPATVTEIGNDAFYQSHISEITIPNTVTSLGTRVFYNCDKLVTVDINCACGIPPISSGGGGGIFHDCNYLKTVTIGDSVTSIGSYSFNGCDRLERVSIGSSVTSIGAKAFCICKKLISINIPDSVTSIGAEAFLGCDTIETITIGNGVETIGNKAFDGCDNLTSITYGTSIKSIGYDAFQSCPKLQYLYINDLASYCGIDYSTYSTSTNYWVSDAHPLYYNQCNIYLNGNLIEDLVIPEGVTKIGQGTFYNCDSLKSVTIPNSVRTIAREAFWGCDNITSIDIPTVIDPDYTTTIGMRAFQQCSKLERVSIGERVSSIGEQAFYCCNILQKFYCKATSVPSLGANAFYGENGYTIGTEMYVPTEVAEAYKEATNWRSYAAYIVGYNF